MSHRFFSSVTASGKLKQLKRFIFDEISDSDYFRLLPDSFHSNLFLGIDVSSKGAGYSIVNADGYIVEFKFIDTGKCKSTIESAAKIAEVLKVISEKYNKQIHVGVEDYLRIFFRMSSANTLFTLAEINALVRYECWKIFGVMPEKFHPSKARKLFGLKAEKVIDVEKTSDSKVIDDDSQDSEEPKNIKSVVFDFVSASLKLHLNPPIASIVPSPKLSAKTKKSISCVNGSWIYGRSNTLSKFNFDIADASLVAWITRHNIAQSLILADKLKFRSLFSSYHDQDFIQANQDIFESLINERVEKLKPSGPFNERYH